MATAFFGATSSFTTLPQLRRRNGSNAYMQYGQRLYKLLLCHFTLGEHFGKHCNCALGVN